MKKTVLQISIIIISLIALVNNASAFSITPSKLGISIDPGQSANFSISLENTEKSDLVFETKILSVRQNNAGRPEFLSNFSNTEKWVASLTKNEVVKANKQAEFDFNLSVPIKTAPGTYYIGMAFQPMPTAQADMGITPQLVTILEVKVSGTAYENLEITKWELNKGISGKNNWEFWLNLNNASNVEIFASSTVSIQKKKGQEIFSSAINLGGVILPETVRFLKPSVILPDSINKWPAIYVAKIKIEYGKTRQTIESQTAIIVLPAWFKILIILLLVITFCIIFWRIFLRKKINKNN
ncbi:MAG: hypothetical protein ABH832_01035 [bacterium]